MIRDEWWIDEYGGVEYANGDIGEYNHETIAIRAALMLREDDDDTLWLRAVEGRMTNKDKVELRSRGVEKSAIEFFSRPNADAREYAIRYMNWIRVIRDNFEVRDFDDDVLRRIQRAYDIWEDGDEESDEYVRIDMLSAGELSLADTLQVPIRVLLGAGNSAQVKAYAAGYRSGFDGLRRNCRCVCR